METGGLGINFFLFQLLLKFSWHVKLCKLKVYKAMIFYTYVVK